ncbi:hypothetical protein, partial [Vibrio splendidus]|uniref:hypothetical protein n=1 Tax=Vibrio splendidus TaxID=29497 RepID=UPI001A7E1382
MALSIFTYHHFLASNLVTYKPLTATKLAEKQKDQSQALLLEVSQEGLHLLVLYCNIPSSFPNLSLDSFHLKPFPYGKVNEFIKFNQLNLSYRVGFVMALLIKS